MSSYRHEAEGQRRRAEEDALREPEEDSAPWLLQAAFDALPADGSPSPLHAVLTALQRQSPGWSVAGVRDALGALVAAGRAYHRLGEGWSRGVPEGWGWVLRLGYYALVQLVPGDGPCVAKVADDEPSWSVWRGDIKLAGGRAKDRTEAQRAAVRACWERGVFAKAPVGPGPRPITRADEGRVRPLIERAIEDNGTRLHFGPDGCLKTIECSDDMSLCASEIAALARAGIVPSPEGWRWAGEGGDPVAEVTPLPVADDGRAALFTSVSPDKGRREAGLPEAVGKPAAGPCARLLPPCSPGQACGVAGCPQCSIVPDVSLYAAHVEVMAEERAQRIRDALIAALAKGPRWEIDLLLDAIAAGGLPQLTLVDLRPALHAIGAVPDGARWRLSDGPPPGFAWSVYYSVYSLVRVCDGDRIAEATVEGRWVLRDRRTRGDEITLPSAQTAALLACRRAGLFAPALAPHDACGKHNAATGSAIGWQSWCPGCNPALHRTEPLDVAPAPLAARTGCSSHSVTPRPGCPDCAAFEQAYAAADVLAGVDLQEPLSEGWQAARGVSARYAVALAGLIDGIEVRAVRRALDAVDERAARAMRLLFTAPAPTGGAAWVEPANEED